MITTRKRLDPAIFDLPVEKMRAGYYTDAYFNHTRATLLARRPPPARRDAGLPEEARVPRRDGRGDRDPQAVRRRLGRADGHALYDGDAIEPYEPVLTIEGDYTTFAHLETVYLGTLARRTLITTNVVRVLEAANGKPIIFMPARHDHHRVQTGDGYAAYVAGQVVGAPIGVTTDEQASWWGGTRPRHRAARADRGLRRRHRRCGEALRRLGARGHERAPCSSTSRTTRCGPRSTSRDALGPRLWGVRLDTSESLVDRSLWEEMGDFRPDRRQPAARPQRARRARRRGLRRGARSSSRAASPSRRSSEFEENGVPGRRLRRRLVADPRLERLHRRHRAHRRRARRRRSAAGCGPNPRLELVT